MRQRHMRRQCIGGFSLVELTMVLAIFLIVAAATYTTMASGRVSWEDSDASIITQENVRTGLRRIGYELRESGRVDAVVHVMINASNDAILFQVPVDADTATPEFDLSSGDILWGAPTDLGADVENYAITYLLVGDQLIRRVVDAFSWAGSTVGTEQVVSNFVTAVSFTAVPDAATITAVDVVVQTAKASKVQEAEVLDHQFSESQRLHVVLRNVVVAAP
jgi:prepilin-type N-terminal cleavage/methylation domain-containing protein